MMLVSILQYRMMDNPRKSCNFVGMNKTLVNYIIENEKFRRVLLKQDGGIMKFWAEHPDSDGLEALRKSYRDLCVYDFRKANKWSMSEEILKKRALAEDHIKKELVYMETLKTALSDFPEVAEQTLSFTEDYLEYAFREMHRSRYPDGIPPMELYHQVISAYDIVFGFAGRCLWRVLKEYRGTANAKKTAYDLWEEFEISQYARLYFSGTNKLRQAIKEMIDKNTQGKSPEECRRICRELAIDTMKSLERFVKRVNGDYDRVIFYKDREKQVGEVWSTNELAKHLNGDERSIKRENIEITANEMAWLRVGMMYSDTSHETPNRNGLTSLQGSFMRYYSLLTKIGHFWAAQLLRHGIDMQELEKEKNIILIHQYYRLGLLYYVDRLPLDQRGDCCVYDYAEAKNLLAKVRRTICLKDITWEEEKQCFKNAVLYVMDLKRKKDGNYLFDKNTLWIAVYRFAIDIAIMYDRGDPNEPQDKSAPQYAFFEKFAHELQLDADPPTRHPFKISSIDSLNKDSYKRYRQSHPWPMDGLKEPSKGFALYKELNAVYIALSKIFFYLNEQASQNTD